MMTQGQPTGNALCVEVKPNWWIQAKPNWWSQMCRGEAKLVDPGDEAKMAEPNVLAVKV